MIDPRFEEQNVPDMLRQAVERMNDFAEDSPAQVLYLSMVLPIIRDRNLSDLLDTSPTDLGYAYEAMEQGEI
jgi:hypothetical protein